MNTLTTAPKLIKAIARDVAAAKADEAIGWERLPDGARIHFSRTDAFDLPAGMLAQEAHYRGSN